MEAHGNVESLVGEFATPRLEGAPSTRTQTSEMAASVAVQFTSLSNQQRGDDAACWISQCPCPCPCRCPCPYCGTGTCCVYCDCGKAWQTLTNAFNAGDAHLASSSKVQSTSRVYPQVGTAAPVPYAYASRYCIIICPSPMPRGETGLRSLQPASVKGTRKMQR